MSNQEKHGGAWGHASPAGIGRRAEGKSSRLVRCPDCGQRVSVSAVDDHAEECPGESNGFDGTCSMCGEPYDEFLEHLDGCPGE